MRNCDVEYSALPSPAELRQELPATAAQTACVEHSRAELRRVLRGEDPRLLAIVGPCSVHDVDEAVEFAARLVALGRELSDQLVLVMRLYFEKPRTVSGWKGLVSDPLLDGSARVPQGLRLARTLLRDVLTLNLPTATEFVDPLNAYYLSDLISWGSIGARTVESQAHRQLASALPMPVGFKNATSGNVDVAVNAIRAAAEPQAFFGIDPHGRATVVRARGNPDGHLVLRGGATGPNHHPTDLLAADTALVRAEKSRAILIDCSHDNSRRNPQRQPLVLQDVIEQLDATHSPIRGVMLESNLHGGCQPPATRERLRYGVSVTDPCLDWTTTEGCLRNLHAALAVRCLRAPHAALVARCASDAVAGP